MVRGHWRLLLACLILPPLAAGVLAGLSPKSYVATTRLQGGTILPGSDTEADALLNLVKGVAASPPIVSRALAEAGVHGQDGTTVAGRVDVARLGSSTVFDLSVTGPDRTSVAATAEALATDVVRYLNSAGDARTANILDGLAARQAELYRARQTTTAALAAPADPTTSSQLNAQLSGIDQQLSDISSTMRQLELSGTSAGSPGAAALITPAAAARPAPTHLGADIGLALVAGLIAGLLATAAIETLRPRVADARAFGRELGVGVIGTLAADRRSRRRRADAGDPGGGRAVEVPPELLVALRAAATRAAVAQILLLGPHDRDWLTALAARLNDARQQDDSRPLNGFAGPRSRAAAVVAGGRPIGVPQAADGVESPPAAGRLLVEVQAQGRHHDGPQSVEVAVFGELPPSPAGRPGLVPVVPRLVRYAELRRVTDLAEVSGWPVLGVIGTPPTTRRRAAEQSSDQDGDK